MRILILILALGWSWCLPAREIRHYVYFELERDRVTEPSFLNTPQFAGAQLKYTWDELEPRKDSYDFEKIERALAFLTKHNKLLFIQIQDLSFDVAKKHVPKYLMTEPEYGGGIDLHYAGEGAKAVPEGWIARRWDKAVRDRFQKLLSELGKRFDGRIAGINLPETAFAYGDRDDLMPKGFSPAGYRDAVVETMKALKTAFPKSTAMQYANFMPGEWLPYEDRGYLRDVYEAAVRLGVAMGSPDLLPYKKGQMHHAYRFLPQVAGKVPTAIAAQEDNYKHGYPVSEMHAFARDLLKVDLIFWCTQEPYYSREVIPFVKKRKAP